ncbi:hypothetical protein [Sporocytophaga sp.]|uniref:hypothetical protein n=1 Tax=Sporocytophaga sp. TaxID=2231183 RepID=UPI0025FC9EFB|nr:hypothetical protein [Sporocytophaga sp.]
MPYDLQIINLITHYSINDKNGYPIIWESSLGCNDSLKMVQRSRNYPPCVKKLIQYSENKLGLVIMFLSEKEEIYYVAIKPKSEQNYSELEVDYKICSENE